MANTALNFFVFFAHSPRRSRVEPIRRGPEIIRRRRTRRTVLARRSIRSAVRENVISLNTRPVLSFYAKRVARADPFERYELIGRRLIVGHFCFQTHTHVSGRQQRRRVDFVQHFGRRRILNVLHDDIPHEEGVDVVTITVKCVLM